MIRVLSTKAKSKIIRFEKDGELYELRVVDDYFITSISIAKNYKRYLCEIDRRLVWERLNTISTYKVFDMRKNTLLRELGLSSSKRVS